MIFFGLRRLIGAAVTLFALMTLTFFAMKAAPGGPFDSELAVSAETRANIEAKFGHDLPVAQQYARYLRNLAHGDFGPSYRYMGGRDVAEIIRDTLPVSFQLGILAIGLAIVVGIPLGVLAAYRKNSWFDFSAMFFAMAGISLPNFLLASILVLIFSMYLGWLPVALWESWDSMVLPVFALSLRPISLIARVTRASMLEALAQDYIRTARAKGLSLRVILFRHALKNAVVPVVTLLGPITAAIITGSFVIENIFAIPGMGKHFVSAVVDRDYTLIMGVTVVYGVIVMTANFIVDVMYGWLDPRIRVTGA